MSMRGWQVVLSRRALVRVPDRCASCGARPQPTLTVRCRERSSPGLAVGYCYACHARARSSAGRAAVATAIAAGFSTAAAALLALLEPLPVLALFAIPLGVAAALGLAAALIARPKMPAAPATAPTVAVRMIAFDGETAMVTCTHPDWALGFAQLNGTRADPYEWDDRFIGGWTAPIASGLAALIVAALVWDYQYPLLYVDNVGEESISIWVDGERSEAIQPFSGQGSPPGIRVKRGPHVLGYSPTHIEEPVSSIDMVAEGSREQLYNPKMSACYWRSVTVYGDSYDTRNAPLALNGPLPRQELYTLPEIDDWFAEPPSQVDSRSRRYRVSIERDARCTRLASRGCSEAAMSWLVECYRSGTDLGACVDEAETRCSR